MTLVLILIAALLAAISGLPGLLGDARSPWGERASAISLGLASGLGLVGAALGFRVENETALTLALPLGAGSTALGLDSLSAFFIAPIFLVGGLGSIYSLGYWPQADHPENGRKLRLFWGWLMAGMVILDLARNSLVFLMGWEVMALSAFFLVSTEDHLPEVRSSGWLYLVATHVGTLFLFGGFGLLRLAVGSFDLRPVAAQEAGLGLLTAIFFLTLLGFGLKAGLMPLHFWLPSAHANAPSHVSAIMSGVLIKQGIYGLVRITTLLPDPPVAWGVLLLVLGAVSGVLGVAFAIGQHDLKRLLAYHSVENIGIIVMGLGVAMIGRSLGRMDWMALGLAGCLLHVWNHGLFKSLLFLCAGSVLHATQTREMDQLGGLAKRMPWTAALFLVGALAICGLPPLNGFVSELFIYLGLFRGLGIGGGPPSTCAALAVPVLAIIGSLAVACFVKAYGTVFLGMARGRGPHEAHESPLSMIGPMGVLAICCALIGFAPLAVAPMLDRAVASWSMQPKGSEIKLESLAPLTWITAAGMILASVAGGAGLILRSGATRRSVSRPGTWDCGYAAPTPRMQYTSSSFAQALVGLFRWILRPRIHQPELSATFLPALHFSSHVDDFVLDGQIIPFARRAGRWLGRLRGLQQGVTQHYVLSILMTVIVLLAWTMPIEEWITQMFAR